MFVGLTSRSFNSFMLLHHRGQLGGWADRFRLDSEKENDGKGKIWLGGVATHEQKL
jgi:hypothetical protein